MSRNKEDSYIFCAALMRASERTLLPEADLTKAAEAATFEDAMAVISEYGYGDGKALDNPRDFAKVLSAEEEKTYEFVFSALPEREELEFFQYSRDYHNAKAALKAEFLGIEPEKYMTEGGKLSPKAMSDMIRERNFMFLSVHMKEAIAETIEVFGKSKDPQEIDIILDRACYQDMLTVALRVDNDFLIGYVKLLIDILNISTFVRLRQMKKPWTFFQKVFLDGGNIKQNLFVASYEEAYQQAADKFEPYGFGEIIEKGAAKAKDTGMYSLMEKLCDNKLIEYIKDAKFISFGIEPAAAFLVAKELEGKNLRMILAGKIAGTPKEVILERLRETYV